MIKNLTRLPTTQLGCWQFGERFRCVVLVVVNVVEWSGFQWNSLIVSALNQMSNICDQAEKEDLLLLRDKVNWVQWIKAVRLSDHLVLVFNLSGTHSLKTFRVFSNKERWVCALFSTLSLRDVFQHIPAKCYWAVMAVWGHLFNTLGSWLWPHCGDTTGGISHAPIVNLPILFTNTDHDNQLDLPVWIASDIICLNLLKAHVDCRSLEWPWCVTLTVHCHLKSETTKWKQLCFLLLWGRPAREA